MRKFYDPGREIDLSEWYIALRNPPRKCFLQYNTKAIENQGEEINFRAEIVVTF